MTGGEYPHYAWEVQGVFWSKAEALEVCLDYTYFIGPVEIGAHIPHETQEWVGAYYPIIGGMPHPYRYGPNMGE